METKTAEKKKRKPGRLFFSPFFHGKNINPDLVAWDSTRLIVQCVLQKPKECKLCIERVVERGTVAKMWCGLIRV